MKEKTTLRSTLRRLTPDLLIALLLLAVPLIFFWRQTLGGHTLLPTENLYQWQPYLAQVDDLNVPPPHNALYLDLVVENIEWRKFALQEISAGRLPLWQNNILAGSPFLAAGQGLTLYPLSLLYLIMPLAAAYGWFTVIQLWIAALNMYAFTRLRGLSRAGAVIAALIYQCSGFLMAAVVFPMILAGAAWLPLALAMIDGVISQRPMFGRTSSIPYVIGGALALGMVALAGHVEVLYFTLLVMAFYGAWRLIEGTIFQTEKRPQWMTQRGLWLISMVGIGLLLGAAQLVPAYELASRSFREGAAGYDQVIGWALPARHVLAFLMPNVFGSPVHHSIFDVFTGQWIPITVNAAGSRIWTSEWGIKNYVEGAVYMGILPMLLAGVAIVRWMILFFRRSGSESYPNPVQGEAAFITLGGLSILFAFGTPAYALLYYGLPFINQSHSPFRWAWPLTLCVAVLAGCGWDALTQSDSNDPTPALPNALGRGFIGLGGVLLIGLLGAWAFYDQIAPLVDRLFNGLALAPNAFADARMFFAYQFWNMAWLGLMLILSGMLMALLQRTGRYAPALAALLIAADLLIPIRDLHPASDPTLLEAVPPSIQWLKDQQAADPLGPFRVIAYQAPGTTKTINANTLWLHGLEEASGYDSLIPGQYAKYMGMIQPQTDLPYNRITPIYADHADALDSPLLDLLGVKYIVSEVTITNPRWVQVYQDEAVRIYENTGVMPRAFSLPGDSLVVSAADDPAEGFAALSQEYDFRQFVIINHRDFPDGVLVHNAAPASPSTAAITIYNPGEVWVDTELASGGWLILTNSYFPGWRAWARPIGAGDEAEGEIPVTLLNGNFMGVRLEPGAWTVRFKYSPDSFKFGALGSFLAGLLALFLIGVWAWPMLYRAEGEGDSAKRVARNAITPVVLNLFNKGILFVLTFASLRILGPEGAGSYRYAVVIWGWFEILSNFGLNTYLTREAARDKDNASAYLRSTSLLRLGLAGLGIPALTIFIWARQSFITPALDQATILTMWILYAGLFFSTLSTGLTALFYAFERAEIPAAIQTISAFLTVGLGVGALLAGWGIIGLAGASLAVNAITLIILWRMGRNLTPNSNNLPLPALRRGGWGVGLGMRSAMSESFPLMINHLLATLFFRIDVVLLEALKGALVVGWYSVVYTWVDTIGIVPAFFTMALFPRMSQMAHSDREGLKRMYLLAVKLMTVLSIPTAIFTTLLAPILINILGGSEYLPHGAIALQLFIWAMIIGWTNSVAQYVIIALNRQRTLTIAFVIGAGFNIFANLIFIPLYSYPAAAVITIFSEAVLWIAFYVVIRQELGGIGWIGILGRLALAGLITAGGTWLLAALNMWLGLVGGVLIYGAAVMLLRPFDTGEIETLTGALPGGIGKLAARAFDRR